MTSVKSGEISMYSSPQLTFLNVEVVLFLCEHLVNKLKKKVRSKYLRK